MAEVQMTQEKLAELVKEIVGRSLKSIHDQVDENQRKLYADHAKMLKAVLGKTPKEHQRDRGADAAKFITALAATKCAGAAQASDWAKKNLNKEEDAGISKALQETEYSSGGVLVPADYASEIVELLRARTVVRAMGARSVDMPRGTLTFPRVATGSTSTYQGEGDDIIESGMTFDGLTLNAKKLTSLIALSNDLITDSPYAAASEARDDMVASASLREDLAFLRGDGSANQPKGLRAYCIEAGNNFDSNGDTDVLVTEDLATAIEKLEEDNVNFTQPGWVLSTRAKRHLISLRDGNGNLVFKGEMDNGMLFGFPFQVTTQIPQTLDPSANKTEVMFCDFAHVRIGDAGGMRIDMADNVTYKDSDGNLVSTFARDETAIRLIQRHDCGPRHGGLEVALIQQVNWGN